MTPSDPEIPEPVADETAETAAPPPGPAYGRRILLVDDDENILRSLTLFLEMEGFAVSSALRGAQALECIGADPPDLVVLDVMMPEMDGFTVLETLKATDATRGLPVIMLTAKGQDKDVLRGYTLGAHAYMTKPVNFVDLVDTIQIIFEDGET